MSERPLDEALHDDERTGLPEFVKDPGGVLRRRWRWMLAAVVLVGTAATAFVATRPVVYQASARLQLSSQRVPEEFVRPITIETISEQVSAIVGEILSTSSLREVAEAHDFAERVGFQGSEVDMLSALRKAITVEPDADVQGVGRGGGTTYILAIRFTAQDPELASDMANGLVDRFTSAHARRQTRAAQVTTQFLRREAERAQVELEDVRRRIAEYKGSHQGELPSELGTKLARLTRLQQQRDSLATQVSDAEGRLMAMRSQGVGDQRTAVLAELRNRLVNQLTVHTEEHPNVKALRRQIANLESELRTTPPSRSGMSNPAEITVQQEIRSLRNQIASVESEIASLDASVSNIPSRQEELGALEQQETLLQEKYVDASRKVRDAELAESLQRAQQGFSVSVLQPAWPPSEPKDSTLKFLLLGVIATLGACLGTALLLELADPVLLTSLQLEKATGLTTLGTVPRIR